jgi:aspartyl-tRNA(Asn)/glutamyl-tRNA(Gln) amidotransferase subunit B
VVSEPDLRSAAEAAEYMRALHQLVRYLGISEGNMEQGHLRCDANVSLRPRGASQLGTRTELKNINSFRFVQRAIEHEIARQARLLDAGGQVVQETRLWDADLGTSQPMRGKEEAEDYRYFPDPDLPPLVVDEARIAGIRETLPELPMAVLARYTSAWGLGVEDARLLCSEPALARYYEACVAAHGRPETGAKPLANWIQAELLRELKDSGTDISACPVTPERLAELVTLIEAGTLSGKMAKQVFSTMYRSGESPRAIVEREGLVQLSDESQLLELGRQILAANPAQVQQYRSGKHNLLGFFVGQFMKQTRGQANPQLVNQLLRRLLDQG